MSRIQRIGIFGGTFDPIHNAHMDIARTALDAARLDRIVFVVSARPPHKWGGSCASAEDRFAMVSAAADEDARFEASRVEIDRSGPSYMVDTLKELSASRPGAELFLIVGLDSFLDLPKWKDPQGILARARLLVVRRPHLSAEAPALLEGHYDMLPFAETDLSSTEVRDRIVAGERFEGLVPPSVAKLIEMKGIYRANH